MIFATITGGCEITIVTFLVSSYDEGFHVVFLLFFHIFIQATEIILF